MDLPHWLAMRLQEIADYAHHMPLPRCLKESTDPCNWNLHNVCINCERARGLEWALAFLANRLTCVGPIPDKTPVAWANCEADLDTPKEGNDDAQPC